MSSLLAFWKSEPAVIVGISVALLDLLVAFGVPVQPDQKVAIIGLVTAVLALLGAAVTRSQVTPVG